MQDEFDPPSWGVLPVEQYLVRYWDHASALPIAEQRDQLLRRFLALSDVPSEWNYANVPPGQEPDLREPTTAEIDTILKPWRPQKIRVVAETLLREPVEYFCPLFLRTHYGGADDEEKLEYLVTDAELIELAHPDDDWRHWVADDEDLFASEEGASADEIIAAALLILPEIAGWSRKIVRGAARREKTRQRIDHHRSELRQQVTDALNESRSPSQAAKVSTSLRGLQELACFRSVIILDKAAFTTDKLLWLFLDSWGNVIRAMRVDLGTIQDLAGGWAGHGNLVDNSMWDDCDDEENFSGPGMKYQLRGEVGKQLYGIDDLLTGHEV